jgi:hypothetical protein
MRSEGKNLNTLVAWGHARSIEDLLGRGIEVEYAVVDKFADEHYLREKVLAGARRSGMRFDHRVRGESDIGDGGGTGRGLDHRHPRPGGGATRKGRQSADPEPPDGGRPSSMGRSRTTACWSSP